jgi:hypothetical protein
MPYLSTPCRQPSLKRPYTYSHFKGGRLQGGWLAAVFYTLGHPTQYVSDTQSKVDHEVVGTQRTEFVEEFPYIVQ